MTLDLSRLADAFNTAEEAVSRGRAELEALAQSHEAQLDELRRGLKALEEEIARLEAPQTAAPAPVAAAEPVPEATTPEPAAAPETAAQTAEPEAALDPTGSHPVVQAATAAAGGGDVSVSVAPAEATASPVTPAAEPAVSEAAPPDTQPTDGNAAPAAESEAGS